MPVNIQVHFKGVGSKADAPKSQPVTWKLRKFEFPQPSAEIRREGATNTSDQGVLAIDGVPMDEDETLQLEYSIGTQSGTLLIRQTPESKIGQPLVVRHYLSLRLELTVTNSSDGNAPVPNRALRWETRKTGLNGAIVQAETDGATGADGKFIMDFELAEQDGLQIKVLVPPSNVSQTVQLKHTPETRNGNPLVAAKGYKLAVINVAEAVAAVTNPGRHWLTYESLFNKKEYKKPNCEFKLHLYLIPINELKIWLRDDLSPSHLQTFVNSFFPDFEAAHIQHMAQMFWSWKRKSRDFELEKDADAFVFSPKKSVIDRDKGIRYLKPYAVLPYNRYDNDRTSRALATSDPNNYLLRVRDEAPYLWSAWKTASRSCIVRLPANPTKQKGVLWKTGGVDSIARDYEEWAFDTSHRSAGMEKLQNNPYQLANRVDNLDFSLKTGVEWVGTNFQGGGDHKDIIGDWLIGCLRSDYITQINQTLQPPSDGLIVLTELITITEKTMRELKGRTGETIKYLEGVQIRDISTLNKNKVYLAPLNIPFVSLDLKEFKPEFHYLDANTASNEREQWKAFWKRAFAAALGRAKALLLLRYGLQILNPNQQNFLIEFEPDGTPTGTIVVRDLNDASIHREIVWALFDGPGLPPQEPDGWKQLAKLDVPTLKFEFEEGRMEHEGYGHQEMQETGTTNVKFGPPGTQFLWQRFSSFGNITKPAKGVGENLTLFKNLLETMSDWGIAHNKSFISCMEAHLGVNFTGLDWSRYPDSWRVQKIKSFDGAENEAKPQVVDRSPSTNGLEITDYSFNKLSPDQKLALNAKIQLSEFQDEFNNEDCLLIRGTGFADNSVVKLGGTAIAAKYIVGKPDLLVVCSKPAEVNPVRNRDKGIEVVNPDATTVHYKYVFDPQYLSEMDWEERSAKIIHDYLATAEGQKAIRACRNRRWSPVKPSFVIQLVNEQEQPMPWRDVILWNLQGYWHDITDEHGKVQFYRASPEDCRISVTDLGDAIKIAEVKKYRKLGIDRRARFIAELRYTE